MNDKIKKILKVVVFMAIFCVLFVKVNKLFGISNEYSEHAEMMVNGYYGLEKNSVDMVVVGNSHVYRYYQPAFAWKEKGIATTAFSTSDMPGYAVKYVAEEVLKYQKPKVLVLDATTFNNELDVVEESNDSNKIFFLTANMKYSPRYFKMINNVIKYSDVSSMKKVSYYLPIVQFHSRWNELNKGDFEQTQKSYLNSCYQDEFLNKVYTKGSHDYITDTRKISEGSEASLRELLEWLKTQDVEVLFFASPVLKENEKTWYQRNNYIGNIINEYGFKFANFNTEEYFDTFDFDLLQDFQDTNHTNVRGSLKFTKVFADYLIENYGLEDKRQNPDYSSWNEAADKYYDKVEKHLAYKEETVAPTAPAAAAN